MSKRRRLTGPAIQRIKPPEAGQVDHHDAALPAFGLRVSHMGTKSFFVMKRVDGRMRRTTLGRYPAMSLADARQKAAEISRLTAMGRDPKVIEEERRRSAERERHRTFGVLADEFMQNHVLRKLRTRTQREYQRVLRGPYTQAWESRPVTGITRADVKETMKSIAERAPGGAKTAFAYLRKFFNWCVEKGYLDRAPTDRVTLSYSIAKRDRVLSEDDLVLVWRAFEDEPSVFGPLFKLLLLTGQRRSEVAGMRWDEVRGLEGTEPVWELPSSRTKNARQHLVPLAPLAVEILQAQPRVGDLVFSTTGVSASSGFSRAKARIDVKVNGWRSEVGLAEMPSWRLHDLRRTMVTHMNERLGIAPHVVEAVVNHLSGAAKAGVAGVYNRALYLEERRRALEAWARFLTQLVQEDGAPNG